MDDYLQEFKETARKLHSEGKLVMFSHNSDYVAYKVADDDKLHVRYVCPKCKYKEEIYDILKFPPKLKCKECKFLVWESKLRKQRGRKTRRSERPLHRIRLPALNESRTTPARCDVPSAKLKEEKDKPTVI